MQGVLQAVNGFLDRYFFWLCVVAVGVGVLSPELGPFAPYVPYQVAFSMLVGALNVRWHQFLGTLSRLHAHLWFAGYLFLAMPALSWVMARTAFQSHPELGLGLILAAVLPCGITASIWTLMARGQLALSLSLITLTTLASGVITPWLLQLWGGSFAEVEVWQLARNLVVIVVVPSVIGLIIHERWPRAVVPWQAPLTLEVKLTLLLIVAIYTAAAVPDLRQLSLAEGVGLVVASIVHLVAGHLGAYVLARRLGTPYEDAVALAFSSGVRNTVAGAAIATTQLTPKAVLPILVILVLQQPLSSLCIPFFRRDEVRAAAPLPPPAASDP